MNSIERVSEAPIVRSEVDPDPKLLLQIRALSAHLPEVQSLFRQYREGSKTVWWLRDLLALTFAPWYDSQVYSYSQLVEACQYLADEHSQIPVAGLVLLNRDTGKIETILSEDDIEQVVMQRESGNQVLGLPRIRPGLEVAMLSARHEKAKEDSYLEVLKSKLGVGTEILDTDPRLRMATRKGRSRIAEDLHAESPESLLRLAGGTTAAFLRYVTLVPEMPTGDHLVEGAATFRSEMGVQDPLSTNLQYNRLGTLMAAAPQGWVRDIARNLSTWAHKTYPRARQDLDEVSTEVLLAVTLWVTDPKYMAALRKKTPRATVIPVEGAEPLGIQGPIGSMFIHPDVRVESHENFKKWEVVSTIGFALRVHPDSLVPLPLFAEPETEVVF